MKSNVLYNKVMKVKALSHLRKSSYLTTFFVSQPLIFIQSKRLLLPALQFFVLFFGRCTFKESYSLPTISSMGTASQLKTFKNKQLRQGMIIAWVTVFQLISSSGIFLSIITGFNHFILRPLASLFPFLNIKQCDSEQQVQQSQYQCICTFLM